MTYAARAARLGRTSRETSSHESRTSILHLKFNSKNNIDPSNFLIDNPGNSIDSPAKYGLFSARR